MYISIILPTYNEAGNIVSLINKIITHMRKTPSKRYEIIVVDDNSPDGTAKMVKKVFSNNKSIRVFIRKNKRGLATAIHDGIRKSRGKQLIVMDTDFNHDPKAIPKLLEELKDYDLVIGSRFIKGGGMEDRIRFCLSYIFNLFIRLTLKLPTRDNLSGFFAIKKDKLDMLEPQNIFYGFGDYFIRLIFYAHKQGLSFKEIPVFYLIRYHGQRKSNFISMLTQYTLATLRLKGEK